MPIPDTFYDVAMRRLDEQMSRISALDAKAATALGGAAALLPIFGALIAAFSKKTPPGAEILYIVGFVLYLLMVTAAVFASRVTDWDLRPDLDKLESYTRSQNEATVKMWAAQECVRAVSYNGPQLDRKAIFVDLALVGLVLVAVSLSGAAMFQLFS